MDHDLRMERRRVRLFFAGLLVISAALDIVGALLVHRQTRSEVLETLLPATVTLGGRAGALLSGVALLLLAVGIARGKRIAFRLTVAVLIATIAFELVKDLDFEEASLFAWILFGLWWFRHHFDADSDPSRLRWGLVVFAAGLTGALLYAFAGANWLLGTLPLVSYALIIAALTLLLRPMLAPRVAPADRERLHNLINSWGRNYISHLAVHGASSYHWVEGEACVAFTLRGRTALALGDPIGPPGIARRAIPDFLSYCDRQDWIPAFYQVDEPAPYRELNLTLVPIGAEAILQPATFELTGKKRADLRYAIHRCEKAGVRCVFAPGPEVAAEHAEQVRAVSGRWLQSRHSPELGYSLGTLATLADPDIVVGLGFGGDGRLESFVSWLPVPARKAWTLDLVRRRPDSTYGVVEALIVRSVAEARERGITEVSLGVAPRIITSPDAPRGLEAALRAMYWGLDRFQRSRSLHRFKEKFGPRWEDRYLVVPSPSTLPEVMVALVRVHVPPLPATAAWIRSALSPARPEPGRPVAA